MRLCPNQCKERSVSPLVTVHASGSCAQIRKTNPPSSVGFDQNCLICHSAEIGTISGIFSRIRPNTHWLGASGSIFGEDIELGGPTVGLTTSCSEGRPAGALRSLAGGDAAAHARRQPRGRVAGGAAALRGARPRRRRAELPHRHRALLVALLRARAERPLKPCTSGGGDLALAAVRRVLGYRL